MARLYSDQPQFDSINIPPEQNFNTAAMNGSLQQFLADNMGEYVIVEFLVGTQTMTQKAGVLYAVGSSVLTLYEEVSQTFITCDIFSVKFVTFFLPGHRPWQANRPEGVRSPEQLESRWYVRLASGSFSGGQLLTRPGAAEGEGAYLTPPMSRQTLEAQLRDQKVLSVIRVLD